MTVSQLMTVLAAFPGDTPVVLDEEYSDLILRSHDYNEVVSVEEVLTHRDARGHLHDGEGWREVELFKCVRLQ